MFKLLRKHLLLFVIVLLQFLDVCIPPVALPAIETRSSDKLGELGWLNWIWNLDTWQQYVVAICTSVLVWIYTIWSVNILFDTKRNVGDEMKKDKWIIISSFVALSGWGFRRWAKITLANQFTYQISLPRELITTGPYTHFIHPSYCGAILHIFGMGLIAIEPMKNKILGLSCVVLVTSIAIAGFSIRIDDEENMLAGYFGHDVWKSHCATRWHLVPYWW